MSEVEEALRKAGPFILLAIWGGTVRYITAIKGDRRVFSFVSWFSQIITSGFVGVVTYLMCQSAGFNPLTTAALVAISGHEGTRALSHLASFWRSEMEKH